jgi:membrane-associated phospholipid phosphatase
MKRSRKRMIIIVALWAAAFALAVAFDRTVTDWVGRSPLFDRRYNSPWKWPKRIGEFPYIIPVIILVAIFHARRWRGAVMLVLASGIAGATYGILKWVVGRARPSQGLGPFSFDLFKGGMPGLLDSGNLAFPSGHATFAFAIAAGMAILLPKWRWLFYLLATMCGVQRILEHAHHPSDIVASALFGVLAAHLAHKLCRYWFGRPAEHLASCPAGSRDPRRATLA